MDEIAGVIVFLARRYRGMFCETHAYMRPERRIAARTADDSERGTALVTRP